MGRCHSYYDSCPGGYLRSCPKRFIQKLALSQRPIAFAYHPKTGARDMAIRASTNSKVNRCTVQREINRQYNCCQIEPNEKLMITSAVFHQVITFVRHSSYAVLRRLIEVCMTRVLTNFA